MATPFIELEQVSRRFGNQLALREVSLCLPPGRIGLLGPNGAGKSTLLKILLGLLAPSRGTGKVLGQPILPPEEQSALSHPWQSLGNIGKEIFGGGNTIRRAMGYMSEADSLIPGIQGVEYVALAGELYGMPRQQARRRAHEVLTYLGLEDARYRKLEEYSTGMKQRIKLAQALVHDPPVLLLDEPTSGMDPEGRDNMLKLLLTLAQDHGKTVLLCTHLLGDVERVCDTIVILYQGEVLCQGSVEELCRRRQDRYCLHIQGDPHGFEEELRLEGVEVLQNNGRGELRVRIPEGWVHRMFFVLADQAGVLIRGLKQDDEKLEEMFHRVIQESNSSTSAEENQIPMKVRDL